MSSDENLNRINAEIILEVIGKPPEHLTETLEDLTKKIGEEKGVSVKNKKIKEPVKMQENKEFYTSFAEIEIEVDEIFDLIVILFKYMPAHVEIISPESITLKNNDWNEFLNEIARRLHGYDEIARVLQLEHAKMQRKLKEASEGK